jgi:hypothetical protein
MANDLLTQLDDLRRAYFAGITTVQYEGKSTTFRSQSEMSALILSLERQIGITTPTRVVARGGKGW